MAVSHEDVIPELPLRRGARDRLTPRLPVRELVSSGRLIAYRYPNGVTGWITTNSEDFRTVLGDPRLHAKRFLGEPQPTSVSVEVPDMPGFIPSMNGPEHLRVRRLAASHFSVRHVQELKPAIERVVDTHLDAVARAGSPVDLYATYTLPIPSQVIADILGVPSSHAPEFQTAARLTIGGLPEKLADPEAPARAVADLHRIIGEVIDMKRARPADDLITRLTQVSDPPLTDTEIKGLCTNLLLAGHETTASSSSTTIAILLRDPELRQKFVSDPERLPDHIEELIRFQALVRDSGAGIPRLATEDVVIHGQLIRKGDWVMASTGLANSDPEVCPVSEQGLSLDRDATPHWVTFGFGPHTCLGQHLARAEVQAIVWKFLQRFPEAELAVPFEDLPWLEQGFGYRIAELPVLLGPDLAAAGGSSAV